MEITKKETTQKEKTFSLEDLGLGSQYDVMLHNDDITPMEFVVIVLIKVFDKDIKTATDLMMTVHTGGKAVIESYSSREEAEEKVSSVEKFNKMFGENLLVTVEEE